ncbi:unnamed protein product [Nesidiocoris tenuis]|uniref:Uncharacterized protein n=1 Tax=Nesidiocoris tenuis TaxID=355587 RepID=A0A6H5GBZ4_9HEMI|nr:unnamed protein product [Nesidiocoris tenuis]
MDQTNADLDPLTFSDRIARTICLELEQATTFKTNFVKIGSAVQYEVAGYIISGNDVPKSAEGDRQKSKKTNHLCIQRFPSRSTEDGLQDHDKFPALGPGKTGLEYQLSNSTFARRAIVLSYNVIQSANRIGTNGNSVTNGVSPHMVNPVSGHLNTLVSDCAKNKPRFSGWRSIHSLKWLTQLRCWICTSYPSEIRLKYRLTSANLGVPKTVQDFDALKYLITYSFIV